MFHENFSNILQQRGLKASQITKDTGIPGSSLSEWKTGVRQPSYDNLLRLADYLEVSIDELLGRQQPMKSLQERTFGLFLTMSADERKAFIQEAIKHI
jgi:transcriptional regulator with XRE-family HTH domain